jgi:hypothetical protein
MADMDECAEAVKKKLASSASWLARNGCLHLSSAHHHQAAGSYSKSKKHVGGGSGAW